MTRILHEDAGAEELATVRIVVFGLLLFTFGRVHLHQLATLPMGLVEPNGIMRLLPLDTVLSSSGTLWAFRIALISGCVACMLGVGRFRWIAVATVVLALFHDGAMRSVAAFDIHVRLTLIYVAAIVALSPCVDAYCLRRARRPRVDDAGLRYAGPMILATLVVAVTYSLVGATRLLEDGVSLFTSDTASIWMVARSLQPSEYDFAIGLWLIGRPWLGTLATLAMLVSTVFEVASPLAIRSRRFRVVWIVAIVSFHVGILMTMNIWFMENVVLVLLLFTPFTSLAPRVIDRWWPVRGRRASTISAPTLERRNAAGPPSEHS